jgi:hypothetical protein
MVLQGLAVLTELAFVAVRAVERKLRLLLRYRVAAS